MVDKAADFGFIVSGGPHMASASVGLAGGIRAGELLLGCAAAQGSAAHAWLTSDPLLKGPDAARNLADAVHFLGALHGRYPGVVDHASNRCVDAGARRWPCGQPSCWERMCPYV